VIDVTESIADDLARQLQEMRRLLRDTRAGSASTQPDGEPVLGTAEAADGLVKVIAETGKLSKIELNPRAMRLPSEDLAEAIVEAANAALADLAAKAGSETGLVADPAALDARLSELQDQSVRQMSRYMQGISEVLGRLGR
jgi:DNA-binding protein YbaB